MHTTNKAHQFITVAPDTKAVAATEPPTGKGSVAERQYILLHGHDYELTSDDVIFTVHADRKDIPESERPQARAQFFSKGQACLRTSPLTKTYGWGVHADADARIALVPLGSERYHQLAADDTLTVTPAMRSTRQ